MLYEKVESGGVVIIDDYGHWGGSKKAVDEFTIKNNLKIEFLTKKDSIQPGYLIYKFVK